MYSSFLCCRIYTGSGVDPHPNLTVSTILCISIGWNLYLMSTGSMIAKFIVANYYHLIQLADFLFQWSSSDFHVSLLSCCRICLRSGIDPHPHPDAVCLLFEVYQVSSPLQGSRPLPSRYSGIYHSAALVFQ